MPCQFVHSSRVPTVWRQISQQTQNFNNMFFGGRGATTSKMDLKFSEEMWQFFTTGSDLEKVATRLGYDLHDVDQLPKAILQ